MFLICNSPSCTYITPPMGYEWIIVDVCLNIVSFSHSLSLSSPHSHPLGGGWSRSWLHPQPTTRLADIRFHPTSGTCRTSLNTRLHPVEVSKHTSPMPTIRHAPSFPIFTEPWSPTLYDEKHFQLGVKWNDVLGFLPATTGWLVYVRGCKDWDK